jgi:hypothetical protein
LQLGERADQKEIEAELSELKQNSAPAARLSNKSTPDAAIILSQLRAKRKKSTATLGDVEKILEILELALRTDFERCYSCTLAVKSKFPAILFLIQPTNSRARSPATIIHRKARIKKGYFPTQRVTGGGATIFSQF